MSEHIKAPFPWFGGKRRVASEVWAAIGDVDNYIEPFAGSLAVLLGRPDEFDRWKTGMETVNDADAYLSNFWRAIAAAPDEVAKWADWPVNETDLIARHLWLVNTGRERIGKMESNPDYYDAKVAGWWVWGLCIWIGCGWCDGKGSWRVDGDNVVKGTDAGQGVSRRRPTLCPGQGVNRKRPHLGDAGRGVNRQRGGLLAYFDELATRLRRVRVCCGDWSRIVTKGAMSGGRIVGVFLDPPYLGSVRDKRVYRVDDHNISNYVREWAIANGNDPRLRIVLAGYEEEHASKMPDDWRMMAYSAGTSYQTSSGKGANIKNRHNERLWFSPHCLAETKAGMFAGGGGA